MKAYWTLGTLIAATVLLAGCGGGGQSGGNASSGPLVKTIAVPNVGAGTNFSFDIAAVDGAKGRMYFTDRNNKAVDVINISGPNTFLKQITGGFAGCNTGPSCVAASNPKSGPNGLNLIPGTPFIYVGDVNSVKIIDTTSDTVVKNIPIGGNSGFRADEGCYDPDHNIFMINSPDEDIPFATFINTTTQTIMATLLFTDQGTGAGGPPSAGLEACAYDHATQSFLNNNDGTTANPHGEVDVIPASFILAAAPGAVLTLPPLSTPGFKVFPLGDCDPTGLDLGPGTDMAVSCRQGDPGVPLTVMIMNRVTGAILATINSGGGDQLAYDGPTNRYYVGTSRWTSSGRSVGSAGCSAAAPCTPVLTIIDAGSKALVTQIVSGNNAHAVAVDPVTHQVYMPFSSAAAPGGCLTCGDATVAGGVLVFKP